MNATAGRVKRLTAQEVNRQFALAAEARVAYYAGHPEEIGRRLKELDEEWDIERAIELEAAVTVLSGFLLGATVSRKWFVLPAFAAAMALLHSIRGEYPLLPLFRRMGFRTAGEIAQERYALKALRGDFEGLSGSDPSAHVLQALAAANH